MAAVVLLLATVLPVKYGFDPLGFGNVLRLTGLSKNRLTITLQPAAYQHDSIEFILGPYESVEYKYRMETNASMLYSWKATRSVSYDFHSEPDGSPDGYAESFDRRESDRAHGTYTAPFSGVHGWYWENDGGGDVMIRLTTSGFYSEPREYFDGNIIRRKLAAFRGVRETVTP